MNYDFFAEDAEIIYNQNQLLLKLYKYLGSTFGHENFVGKYDTDGKDSCYECGLDLQNEAILELRKYVESLNNV